MIKKAKNVYQFKITLNGIKPSIWRQIQVPETYDFWDLHVAIQDSMGWSDGHLHQFTVINPHIGEQDVMGIPFDDYFEDEVQNISGIDREISFYFSNKKASYKYDFGDSWEHIIKLEKILPPEPGVKYPRILAGQRACPPEDCGGVFGYGELLRVLKNPQHPGHQESVQWVGRKFNSEIFNIKSVRFESPKKRWRLALQ